MASVANDPGGLRRVLFVDPQGDRKAIRLGKVSQRAAESVKLRVEQLLSAKLLNRAVDADTARWVAELPPAMADKLARVGLVPKRERAAAAKLGPFVESYITRRADVSPHTRRIWRQTAGHLSAHFGADRPLAEITRGDAADWRLTLVSSGLADASVRKHCGFAKHFFAQAVDHELIASNPFAKLVSSPVGNAARQYFVSREETAKILDEAPDAEWRLIIALSRYGGLRCPSEHLGLTWGDVDWAGGKLMVRSPKTARHAGHESRLVPLFPELRPYLDAVWFPNAGPGEHVITRYRDNANLRTQLRRIIRRAGLTPWPRITHNLRASRATELAAEHPAHVAAAWLGHSALVAQKHYWTVTDADFERAIQGGAESGARAAQNRAQHAHAEICGDSHETAVAVGAFAVSAATPENKGKMAEVHGNRTHRTPG
jgi:integrase